MKKTLMICGKIRNTERFTLDIDKYYDWKEKEKIDRIVFSGWIAELHDNPRLLDRMSDAGVDVILDREPEITLLGSLLHQMVFIKNGLSLIDADDVVFKTRTDKFEVPTNPDRIFARYSNARPPGERSPFRKRILIPTALERELSDLHQMTYFRAVEIRSTV
jgi:hypothetical protein